MQKILDFFDMENAPKRRWISLIVITLFIALLFFVLNHLTHYVGDDYYYMYSFSTGERIENFSQIIDSQIAHYSSTNGRRITHTLAHLFLMMDEDVFDLLNTVVFCFFLYVLYFHACGSFRKMSVAKFSVIAMLVFVVHPAFGDSYLWTTGASNYLYGTLIFLCALIPYRCQLTAANAPYSLFVEVLAAVSGLLGGFIAGWTNENTSVAMIVMMICFMIFFRIKSIRFHAWNFTGCMGAIAGCYVMLSAPGNSVRLSGYGSMGSVVVTWLERFVIYTCDMFEYFHLLLLLLLILVVAYVYQSRRGLGGREHAVAAIEPCAVALIYFIGFLASVYSMIASPYFPGRAWSGPLGLMLIVLVNMWGLVDLSDVKDVLARSVLIVFLLVFCGVSYIDGFMDVYRTSSEYHWREWKIEQAIEAGESVVELPSIYGFTSYTVYGVSGDLMADSSGWRNYSIARYYGLDEVIRVD